MNNKVCSLRTSVNELFEIPDTRYQILIGTDSVLSPQHSALIYRDVVYAGNVGNNFQYNPRH